MNYKTKCYFVENERIFGDIYVTHQTHESPQIVNNPQVSSMHIQSDRNLTQQTLETPDFMALNKLIAINGKKRRGKSTSNSPKYLSSGCNGIQTHNENHYTKGKLGKKERIYPLPVVRESHEGVVVSSLVDQLLSDIYRFPRSDRERSESESTVSSFRPRLRHRYLQRTRLQLKSKGELSVVLETLQTHINHAGGLLIRQLRRRDYLRTKRDRQYDVITAHLQAYSNKRSEDTRMRFSLTPQPGESGFTQWLDAMKMVARLPGGIPQEFRKRLWLTLAERHLEQRGVDWKQAEKLCFNEWTNPDDEELGIQIVKDLHRTGCSLFCGAAGRDNQAVLRRVLLGFARWNKSVGYCQGLNVLAALVLQVMDRAEASAVKVMIYLIEGVLPEGYFADNLRGLSVDMAVFRDLLRMRLPKLSRHLEALQCDAKDKATGSSYEPPLTNVFTMQWFLTLFCHCLPQDTVFRVWDLIFLEGDEVLLRTALAIWEGITDRIMPVTSADEFYSIMGVLTREMLEFTDTNNLIKMIVNMGPLHGITDLREKHRYNITPWARRLSDDEDTDTEDEEKLAVAAAMFGMSQRAKKDRRPIVPGTMQTMNPTGDRDKLALDISTLKQQYSKLRERQRQAHIILSAACARQTIVTSSASQAMNHLLVGKSALVSSKTRQLGPPIGAIPPKTRITSIHSPRNQSRRDKQGVTLHWKDTKKLKETKNEPAVTEECESEQISPLDEITVSRKSSSSSLLSRRGSADSDSDSTSTELCDEPDRFSDSEELTSTSDYYVMATDDDRSPHRSSSPISSVNTSIHSPRNATKELSLNGRNVCDDFNDAETSNSIAKITDQIRRLSAGDDSNPIVEYLDLNISEKKVREELTKENSETKIGEILVDKSESKGDSSRIPALDVMNFTNEDNPTKINVDDIMNRELSPAIENCATKIITDEMSLSSKVQCTELSSSDAIDIKFNADRLESSLTRRDNIESMYPTSRSLDMSGNDEHESHHNKVPISTRSNTLDCANIYPHVLQDDTTKMNDIESVYCPKSYVIGHMPISPATIDKKLAKLPEKQILCQLTSTAITSPTTTLSAGIHSLNSEPKLTTYKMDKPKLSVDYNSSSSIQLYQDKKLLSPKSPESATSVSSGETMGPDSRVSSIATTPLTSELCKFSVDKSECSSISSESKTLTLVSIDSNEIGPSRSKLDSRSDIIKPSFDKSTPSTPISTDSLRNKSELVSPSKLIASSSSDSYNNSPSKVKCTDRSFSSGLQSPISANSIKYTANYRGQDDLSESPVDLSSATSPFYPIANPNQKSPSPNRTIIQRKNMTELEDVIPEKASFTKDTINKIMYSYEEMPKVFKVPSAETDRITKSNDDYDSGRPFETELAETLSSTRLKNDTEVTVDQSSEKKLNTEFDNRIFRSDIEERLSETDDTISPLIREKYDIHATLHSNICDMSKKSDNCDDNYSTSLRTRDSTKSFERSNSSLEKRFSEMKLSTSSEDFLTSKKRSSDILADLRHLEANTNEATTNPQTADTIMTRKTGYGSEDLKNLEARRQDNFSDSASEFSKYRLDIPSISVSADGRKSYIVEPKIQIDANSDSILKNYTQKKDNGEPDDDKDSKLGVWTKVKPRKIGENGRRSSSDRAFKIMQENSAILHKILTCQAKKCLPDLEEISKEITISPINEEISKIFSPILEKMGLNEHEINEELARINFKDFDQMTMASGSEFDAKINDELSKLSLIDDNEVVTHLDVDEMIEGDYLNTRDALIDKQINEELSKLLANYEHEASPLTHSSLRDKGSLSQNPSEIEALDLSSVSTNVFSYQSSSDSIETKSDLGSIQDSVVIQTEKFSQYTESGNGGQNYDINPVKYGLQDLSPRSDIDIYRELEKLDKISSARVIPSFTTPSVITPTLISPDPYTTESPALFPQVSQSVIEYSIEPEKPFESSPVKSPHHTSYKPYDYPSLRISPLKTTSTNSISRSYQTPSLNEGIEFNERNPNSSRTYDLEAKRNILTKEHLEFRVRYDDDKLSNQRINDDLSIEPYQTDLPDLDRGASYYADESPMTLKRLNIEGDRKLMNSTVSPLDYSYDRTTDLYKNKFATSSPASDNYVYAKPSATNDYESKSYPLSDIEQVESSYSAPLRRRDIHSHSPNYQFVGREYVPSSINNYIPSKLSPSLEAAGTSESVQVIASEFVDEPGISKYAEVSIPRDSIAYRKNSMTLGPLDTGNRVYSGQFHETPSPKSQFNPFPARTSIRRPKELALKLGLYSPSSPGSTGQSKRS